jgi:hypothetical protein
MSKVNRKEKHENEAPMKIFEPYIKSILSTKVLLSITEVGKNIKQNLEKVIVSKVEGRCIVEGYIRPDSINILTYSAGKVQNGKVEFQITYECLVCQQPLIKGSCYNGLPQNSKDVYYHCNNDEYIITQELILKESQEVQSYQLLILMNELVVNLLKIL